MQIWRLPSISLEQSNEISTEVEKVVRAEFPEVTTIVSRTGRAEIATDPMGVEISDTYLILDPENHDASPTKESLVAGARPGAPSQGARRDLQLLAADRAPGLGADLRGPLRRRGPYLRRRPHSAEDQGRRGRARPLPGAGRSGRQGRADRRACRCSACASIETRSHATGSTPTTSSRWSRRSADGPSARSSRARSDSISRCASTRRCGTTWNASADLRVAAPGVEGGLHASCLSSSWRR